MPDEENFFGRRGGIWWRLAISHRAEMARERPVLSNDLEYVYFLDDHGDGGGDMQGGNGGSRTI